MWEIFFRYVAERIARTEMARAYADGFIAKMNQDVDIVAVKFKLSGRHPTFDICDMYAKADMYNLGKGVYPKDKLPPLPVHPHCLCRYSEIYIGEVDTTKEKLRIREAGDKWLEGLADRQRQKVLGAEGVKAWKAGCDWRKYMHGYAGFEKAKSRLTKPKVLQDLLSDRKVGEKTEILQKVIDGLVVVTYPGFTKAKNKAMLIRQKELLTYAMTENNSNEVAFLLDDKLNRIATLKGDEGSVDINEMMLNHLGHKDLQMLHNHPRGSSFSMDDITTLISYDCMKGLSLITNRGRMETLQKTGSYDKMKAAEEVNSVIGQARKQGVAKESDAVKQILLNLVKMGALSWKK